MPFPIEDGRGSGVKMGVSTDGTHRGMVDSRSENRAYYASRDFGKVFGVTSHDATAAAGTHPLYIQNTSSTENLVIDLMRVGGVASILWKVWFADAVAATGGSALTPTNFNRTSSAAASATVRGNDAIGGAGQSVQISAIRSAANGHADILFNDTLILGQNDAILVEADTVTSTDVAEIFCRFFFEKHGDL